MDRLIAIEPSNLLLIRIDRGHKCPGHLTLRNVMHTMPVAFMLQPLNKARYTSKPPSAIIPPLASLAVEITYHLPQGSFLPDDDSFPRSGDSFLLHSVVALEAAVKNPSSDMIPSEWFTMRKKQVFVDSGIKVMFVGPAVLARLVEVGSVDEIREVLERSDPEWKSVDAVDREGRTLLHLAIARRRPDVLQLLLEFGPDLAAFSGPRPGLTPLEAAVSSADELAVELLLSRGASTSRGEDSSMGAIHLASINGHLPILKLLLEKGADVNALTKDGATALHLAVGGRKRDIAKLLLSHGAATDIRNDKEGDSVLHVAARFGDDPMIKLLLKTGANKEIRNRYGKTPSDLAEANGHAGLFNALRLGDSLCKSARAGEVGAIHRVLENGAALSGRDQNGWTALHRVSFKGHIDAARALLDKGIDVDARDGEGYTALHCAAESGHGDLVEILVKKGANVEARTHKGATAVQMAESMGYVGVTRILVQNGASKDGIGLVNHRTRWTREGAKIMKQTRRKSSIRVSSDRSLPLGMLPE